VYLAEKQQIPILIFGLTLPSIEPKMNHTHGEHANYYTTDLAMLFNNT
jgi:hypothetical protein